VLATRIKDERQKSLFSGEFLGLPKPIWVQILSLIPRPKLFRLRKVSTIMRDAADFVIKSRSAYSARWSPEIEQAFVTCLLDLPIGVQEVLYSKFGITPDVELNFRERYFVKSEFKSFKTRPLNGVPPRKISFQVNRHGLLSTIYIEGRNSGRMIGPMTRPYAELKDYNKIQQNPFNIIAAMGGETH